MKMSHERMTALWVWRRLKYLRDIGHIETDFEGLTAKGMLAMAQVPLNYNPTRECVDVVLEAFFQVPDDIRHHFVVLVMADPLHVLTPSPN